MDKTKIQALVITTLIIGGVIFFFVPKPAALKGEQAKNWMPKVFKSSDKKIPIKEKKINRKANVAHSKAESAIDSYEGVAVYHNGSLYNVYGRNVSNDGYNLGLKWQCVEFAKRFYYEKFGHKMPNNYGHANEYMNYNLSAGAYNADRGLYQFYNGGTHRPTKNAILIFDNDPATRYGHLGIITGVFEDAIEMVSQNNGKYQKTRSRIPMTYRNGIYRISSPYVAGWLSR